MCSERVLLELGRREGGLVLGNGGGYGGSVGKGCTVLCWRDEGLESSGFVLIDLLLAVEIKVGVVSCGEYLRRFGKVVGLEEEKRGS